MRRALVGGLLAGDVKTHWRAETLGKSADANPSSFCRWLMSRDVCARTRRAFRRGGSARWCFVFGD